MMRRPSLTGRLVGALALVATGVFLAIGMLLYRGFEARLIQNDHEQLAAKASMVLRFLQEAQQRGEPDRFSQRMADMAAGHRNLRLAFESPWPRTDAPGDALARAVVGDPIRERGDPPLDSVELLLPAADGGARPIVRLTAAATARTDVLSRYRAVLVAAALGGVLLITVLGAIAARWSLGNLRRLSADAARIESGERLQGVPIDTELVELVDAFNASLAQIEGAYRQLEGFSADVAHELRSPLAAAISHAQVVLSAERGEGELREALASNLEDLERLTGIVNNMLFLARADQGERARSLARIDLAQLVDELIDYVGPPLEEAGATIVREGSVTAVCNPPLVRRAIVNLFSNAIRHAEGDRRIVVALRAMPARVTVTVFNPGQPVAPDLAQRMFDRFYCADPARYQRGERHGLGLAIVRAVASMHGGRVFAEPRADGTAVGIELPGALARGQRRLREREHFQI